MSIFTKSISQLTTADLQELLEDGAVENIRLEFKSEVPGKDETLKKLSAFANTFGGYMVVGASARSSDGRIEALPGVDVQNGYKQKVVDWCFGGSSPPLTVEVSDPIATTAADGKVCYVAYAAESNIAPHFLNGRKGVYIRTDEFSSRFEARLANDNELRHLFDRRKLIQERRADLLHRARKRFARYAVQRAEELNSKAGNGDQENKLGANLTIGVVPRYPARMVTDQSSLAALVQQNTMQWRGVMFPKTYNPMISQHESLLILNPEAIFSLFEVNTWGMLFYGSNLEGKANGRAGIHLHHAAGCVLLFLYHSARMLRAMRYSGPITLDIALTSILGVPWVYESMGFPEFEGGSLLDDAANFVIDTTTADLNEKADTLAKDVLRCIGFATNLPDLVNSSEKLEGLVAQGYRYNNWQRAEQLATVGS